MNQAARLKIHQAQQSLQKKEVIWEGSEDLNNWKDDIELGVAGIPLAEEGGILTVEYTATGAAQIQIVNKLGENWTWTPMETADGNEYFDTVGGKLQIKLTAAQAEALAASKAMFLKGTGAVVTKITYKGSKCWTSCYRNNLGR